VQGFYRRGLANAASIIIHLRVSDSQIAERTASRQRITDLRLFHPDASQLTQVNACVFTWLHSENESVARTVRLSAALQTFIVQTSRNQGFDVGFFDSVRPREYRLTRMRRR
jgi:hypothetical protein